MRWINRRVESIHILTGSGLCRNISMDINMGILKGIAEGYFGQQPSHIPVPLGFLPKGLLVDLNVLGPDGSTSLAIWTREADSAAAQDMVISALCESDARALPDCLRTKIGTICSFRVGDESAPTEPTDHERKEEQDSGEDVKAFPDAPPPQWSLTSTEQQILQNDPASVALWNRLVTDSSTEFWTLLLRFTNGYMPIVDLPWSSSNPVIKYRVVTGRSDSGLAANSQTKEDVSLGKDFQLYEVQVDGAMEGQREHLRICLPDGLEVASEPIAYVSSNITEADRKKIEKGKIYRVTPRRLIIYRNRTLGTDLQIKFGIRPTLTRIGWPLLFSLSLGALTYSMLLLFGISWQQVIASLPNGQWWQPILNPSIAAGHINELTLIAGTILGAGVFSGVFVISDDQWARGLMLKGLLQRSMSAVILSVFVAVLTISASASPVARASFFLLWIAICVYCLCRAVAIGKLMWRSGKNHEGIINASESTTQLTVKRLSAASPVITQLQCVERVPTGYVDCIRDGYVCSTIPSFKISAERQEGARPDTVRSVQPIRCQFVLNRSGTQTHSDWVQVPRDGVVGWPLSLVPLVPGEQVTISARIDAPRMEDHDSDENTVSGYCRPMLLRLPPAPAAVSI